MSSEIKMLLDRLCGYTKNEFDAHRSQLIERDGRYSELLRALVTRLVIVWLLNWLYLIDLFEYV